MGLHRLLTATVLMISLMACGNGSVRTASTPEHSPLLKTPKPADEPNKQSPHAQDHASPTPLGESPKPSKEEKEEPKPPPFWMEADSVTLYSLFVGAEPPGQKRMGSFGGYGSFGKVEMTKPKQQRAVMGALKEGMASSNARMAKCFNPRHGIRVSKGDQTIDYVICFECGRVEIHWKGETLPHKPIRSSPESMFNKVLKASKVPISSEVAPKPFIQKL